MCDSKSGNGDRMAGGLIGGGGGAGDDGGGV